MYTQSWMLANEADKDIYMHVHLLVQSVLLPTVPSTQSVCLRVTVLPVGVRLVSRGLQMVTVLVSTSAELTRLRIAYSKL